MSLLSTGGLSNCLEKRQNNYLMRSHKFDIELPKTVEEAYALDAKNSNSLWADVISELH